jgi:hypothetical protein
MLSSFISISCSGPFLFHLSPVYLLTHKPTGKGADPERLKKAMRQNAFQPSLPFPNGFFVFYHTACNRYRLFSASICFLTVIACEMDEGIS